jgi:hypothetical protein
MGDNLETPGELTNAMRQHSGEEALLSLTQWLHHRDEVADQLAADDLATTLDTLAADFRTETAQDPSLRTPGLTVAAAVLNDTADEIRGDPVK